MEQIYDYLILINQWYAANPMKIILSGGVITALVASYINRKELLEDQFVVSAFASVISMILIEGS